MKLQNCIQFASENPVCYLATNEGDQPRVRGLLMWFADDNGFHFATLSPKDMSQQMKNNPKVELCFYNNAPELQDAKMMRLTGEIELVEDKELHKKIVKERSFLGDIAHVDIDPLTEVWRINHGITHFWTMADVLKEKELERIKF